VSRASGSAQETQENRMNELIRELVEALEYEHSFLTGRESHYGESVELLIRARAYLETGGWTLVGETYTMQAIAPHSSVITHARLDRSLPPGTELFARIATPEPPKG
jgi:hypothetical protein